MRLTRFTDYALRVLIYLAANDNQPATIAQIATKFRISRNHLMKVVPELSQQGYIIGQRGKGGGLRLAMAPEDINLGELVRAMENDWVIAECFGDNNQCLLTPACALQPILREALTAFLNVLDGYSLADIVNGRRGERLAGILATS
ncbi:Rrf2 family transcriptional regulator [Seongchinamella sediminis]|uniref:Rrf2 family transcriptional regulator n=1 Tax=Seongchinamella sediminis TaxID=2283635 RepID=A0A3L7E548_9GAMM|nr:Rrf2 family transcriptional regulator [Seongchinamella sediminis]RLQ23833.1 Rrf2 family transcriptional regulator [Seongchinamella sediminis]